MSHDWKYAFWKRHFQRFRPWEKEWWTVSLMSSFMCSSNILVYLHNFLLSFWHCLLCVLTNMLTGFSFKKSWLKLTAMAHKLWRKTLAYIHCFAMTFPLRTVGKSNQKIRLFVYIFRSLGKRFLACNTNYQKVIILLRKIETFWLFLPTVRCLKHTSREHIFTTLVSCFCSLAQQRRLNGRRAKKDVLYWGNGVLSKITDLLLSYREIQRFVAAKLDDWGPSQIGQIRGGAVPQIPKRGLQRRRRKWTMEFSWCTTLRSYCHFHYW